MEVLLNKYRWLRYVLYSVAAFFCFAFGFWVRAVTHICPVAETKVETQVKYQDRVKTEIAYVPKETIIYRNIDGTETAVKEKTDLDINIGKPQLNVKVNDKEFEIAKAEDEKYIFDKNKVTLDQTSTANLNIAIPVVDKTRHWQIGIGASKSGVAGLAAFPIKKDLGGWVAGDKDTVMGGISIKF